MTLPNNPIIVKRGLNMRRLILSLAILCFITLIACSSESYALRQTAGTFSFDLSPGNSTKFEWGLASDNSNGKTFITISAEGDGAEFLSFEKNLSIEPLSMLYVSVQVNIPDDYPGDVTLNPRLLATESGKQAGGTVVNIRMQKTITLNIEQNPNPEFRIEPEPLEKSETSTKEPTPSLEEAIPTEEKDVPSSSDVDPEPQETDQDSGLLIKNKPPQCGPGTELVDGICKIIGKEESGGGCLIATATYGSELAPEVQKLRELRDTKLLSTNSGFLFMSGFNNLYYSFSPPIADYERENPYFKEFVKLSITPMISSLSILNHVEMGSEAEVLTYGISLILLNVGMYVGIPVTAVFWIRKKTTNE